MAWNNIFDDLTKGEKLDRTNYGMAKIVLATQIEVLQSHEAT